MGKDLQLDSIVRTLVNMRATCGRQLRYESVNILASAKPFNSARYCVACVCTQLTWG